MIECELLSKCGFFRKYAESKELACRGFITRYCKGEMENCKRKEFRKLNGVPPSDDMMPSGQMIKI